MEKRLPPGPYKKHKTKEYYRIKTRDGCVLCFVPIMNEGAVLAPMMEPLADAIVGLGDLNLRTATFDPLEFYRWMVERGWTEHSSKEYFYRSEDHHQWPPDETSSGKDLIQKFIHKK